MLKKLLSIVVAVALVMTSGVLAAYARSPWKSKPDSFYSKGSYKEQMKELKELIKKFHKDREKREEILKEMQELKKKHKDYSVSVFVNGEEIECDIPSVIKEGRTLIPVVPIVKALGAEAEWDKTARTLKITKDDTTIILKLGSNIALVNGVEVKLDDYVQSKGNGTVVPISFIIKVLKHKIEFGEGSVIIDEDRAEMKSKYEAEEARLSGGAVVSANHNGYSGTGFVAGYWNVGAAAKFSVNVEEARAYDISLHYANSTGRDRTLSIYVNDVKVKSTLLSNLKDWNTWASKTERLMLKAGYNRITYKYDAGDTGNVNLDYLELERSYGILSGKAEQLRGSVNLSSAGTIDWVHWGLNGATSFNRKSRSDALISNYKKVGDGNVAWFSGNPVLYSWTGGTPASSATNSISAVYIAGEGNGFEITVPAGITERTIKVYVGAWGAKGKMEASLSDGSAPVYTGYLDSPNNITCKVFEFDFKAASDNQMLIIRYTVDNVYIDNFGNITLQAAALE